MQLDIIEHVRITIAMPSNVTDKSLVVAYATMKMQETEKYKDIQVCPAPYQLRIVDASRNGQAYHKDDKMQDWKVTFSFFKA
jgi:hypothetical protein